MLSKNPSKHLQKNLAELNSSKHTFEDIYSIIFKGEGIFAESSVANDIRKHTRSEMREIISQIALAIQKLTGQNGVFIALDCETRIEWIILFWAILKSGNKPYLVNPNHSVQFINQAFETLEINYTISRKKKAVYNAKNYSFEELEKADISGIEPAVFGNEIALQSSGTSMKQKICIYSGKEITAQIMNANELVYRNPRFQKHYRGKMKILVMLPLYHIFGLFSNHLWLTFWGSVLVFPEKIAPSVIIQTVKLHKVTHIFSVPVFWSGIEKEINSKLAKADEKTVRKFENAKKKALEIQNKSLTAGVWFSSVAFKNIRKNLFGNSVQFCITGGSEASSSSIETLSALGYPLFNGYGMTEIGISAVDFSVSAESRKNPSIGAPLPSYEFAISEEGTLLAKGTSVCKKILVDGKMLENTSFFDTGDLVKAVNGKYYITGRNSDLVISDNGENINPCSVEQMLSLPAAEEFCVFGDEKKKSLVLLLHLPDTSKGKEHTLYSEIMNEISLLPPVYSFKKILYTYSPLKEGGDIKISREKLRKKMLEGKFNEFTAEKKDAVQSGTSEIKDTIKSIYARVLAIPEDKILEDGNFMKDLGGTSLEYISVVYEIEEKFNVRLQVEEENEAFNYSLNDFVNRIEEITK